MQFKGHLVIAKYTLNLDSAGVFQQDEKHLFNLTKIIRTIFHIQVHADVGIPQLLLI